MRIVGAEVLAQAHQLAVDAGQFGVVVVDETHVVGDGLELAHQVEPATPADALLGVGRVGDPLQFVDDEAGEHELPGDEPGLDDVERGARR